MRQVLEHLTPVPDPRQHPNQPCARPGLGRSAKRADRVSTVASRRRKIMSLVVLPAIDARTAELLEHAVAIEQEDARAAGTISFVSRIFCQVALPYRDPGPLPSWWRTNGTISLRIQPGFVTGKDGQPHDAYPFGVMPRYLLAWMATEIKRNGPAVQEDGLTLDLGGSMRAFLRQIGIASATGGAKGSGTRLRDQVTRLAYASVTVTENTRSPPRYVEPPWRAVRLHRPHRAVVVRPGQRHRNTVAEHHPALCSLARLHQRGGGSSRHTSPGHHPTGQSGPLGS